MAEAKSKILIVEDDLDVAEMLTAYFRVQGYEIFTVNWGEDGVRAALDSKPELIILDIRLPDIDGFEVARRVRMNHRTQTIPIIFLTEKRDRVDRLQGFELGADDYITKPFDVQELRLRVRNALRRATQDSLTNPVTSLPDGQLVKEHLDECLQKESWATLLISLENLEAFREAYGFVASDDVLRAVSLMVANVVRDAGCPGDFLGHLSPTDFIVISTLESLPALQERICSRIEQSLDYFYPIKDRELTSMRGKRLSARFSLVKSTDGNFKSVDDLRHTLMRKKG